MQTHPYTGGFVLVASDWSIHLGGYRAVDAIVTRFNIYSAFAHGQLGLGKTGSGDAVKVVDCRGCKDVQLSRELVYKRLVVPIYRFCGGSDRQAEGK